jgi:L-alanine-DL-glutamate epimerase-like enolase superfamily enzyme
MVLKETLVRNGSYLELPERPGLGVVVDEEKLMKYVSTE